MLTKEEISKVFKSIQESICNEIEAVDGSKFQEDLWNREEGGGGATRIISGNVIEKGGVNFSAVHGPMAESMSKQMGLDSCDFFATGVSIVMHSVNPLVPIIHMNIRYFEITGESNQDLRWFGGGIDLTPHYVKQEDGRFFHHFLKDVCDKHDPSYYPEFKQWADNYFFIKHRNETRGIGGIFFDQLKANEKFSIDQRFEFVKEVGSAFAPIYTELIKRNKNLPFTDEHKQWQFLRRGRYVEFNLVYDRGTKFGLETDGRTESILMSLPAQANWEYNFVPTPGSAEEATLKLLRKGVDW